MKKGLIGKKLGMTQIFDDTGKVVPVTVVNAGPCVVVQKKTTARDGYDAVKLGFGALKERRATKPHLGQLKKANISPVKHLREFRLEDTSTYEVGNEVKADLFEEGELVDVTGISRGKGFAGGVKRWGFKRGPMAHGSKYHRGVGSLQSRDASRVFKGRKMPGHMGSVRATAQGLRVVRVDPEQNLLLIKGAIPGAKGSVVMIKDSVKA